MKAAALDVLHNSVEDLKNELAGFKKTMAGICHKYDDNFHRNGASARHLHEGWLSHEAAIEKINEHCTCGVDSEDDFETIETVSSPSPVGTPVLPEPVPLQVMPSVRKLEHRSHFSIFLTMDAPPFPISHYVSPLCTT